MVCCPSLLDNFSRASPLISSGCQLQEPHTHYTTVYTHRKKGRQEEKLAHSLTKQRKNTSDSSEFDLLWRDYFNPNSKTHQGAEYKRTEDPLWLSGCDNPYWVQEELEMTGLQPTEVEDGELFVEKERGMMKVKGICYKAQQEEEVEEDSLTVCDSKHGNSQDDIGVAVALVASLKACTKQKNLLKGSILHSGILKTGLLRENVFVGSSLVNMYAKCGALEKAQEVFDELPARNVVLWNTIISGYAQHGHSEKALICFERMLHEGLSPDAITFVCALKACGGLGAANKGQELHAHIVEERLLEADEDYVIANSLMDMYAKCGLLRKAQEVFDNLLAPNVVSWNTLIAGYAQHGQSEHALNCYEQMQLWGLSPDAVTFVCVLKACGNMGMKTKGQELHAEIVTDGLFEQNSRVGTALVHMYARCGSLAEAQEVFDELPVGNIVAWTTLILGYAQHGHGERALSCFEKAQHEGFSSNAVTFVCTLNACGSIGAIEKGQELHAKIVREGSLEKDMVVGTALVDMYASCGLLADAKEVFDEMSARDVVAWTALIAGYAQYGHGDEALKCLEQMHCEGLPPNTVLWNALIAGHVQHGHSEEALNCFLRMQLEGFSPDSVTLACMLKTCSSRGLADQSLEMHSEIVRKGLLDENFMVANALVDVYAKNGLLAEAQVVFDKLQTRDIVSWNSLMSGYALLSHEDCVFNLFDKMIGEGQKPDSITFTIVLDTCSHGGLLDMGQLYFKIINKGYGMVPTLEHHTCMVDLFGRTGDIDEALVLIQKMPFSTDLTLWHTLLGVCGKLGNVSLGRQVFEHAAQLDEMDAAAYVCVSNVCAGGGRR